MDPFAGTVFYKVSSSSRKIIDIILVATTLISEGWFNDQSIITNCRCVFKLTGFQGEIDIAECIIGTGGWVGPDPLKKFPCTDYTCQIILHLEPGTDTKSGCDRAKSCNAGIIQV